MGLFRHVTSYVGFFCKWGCSVLKVVLFGKKLFKCHSEFNVDYLRESTDKNIYIPERELELKKF